jgi:hypothetical protein
LNARQFLEEQVEQFDVLAICDVARWPAEVTARLASFVRSGGMLQLWLGERCRPEFYNQLQGQWPWWRTSLKDVARSGGDGDQAFTVMPSAAAGAFAAFRRWPEAGLGRVAFHRYWRLAVGDDPQTRTLLSLDADAAVLETRVGAGSVVVFATSPDLGWSGWPLHASFVPSVQGLVWEHVRRGNEARVLRIGEVTTLPGQPTPDETPASVRAPDGHLETLPPAPDEAGTAFMPLLQGLYRVGPTPGAEAQAICWVGQRQSSGLDESAPRLLTEAEVDAAFPNAGIHALAPSLPSVGPHSVSGIGARWFLVAAIALVAAELMLATAYVERASNGS